VASGSGIDICGIGGCASIVSSLTTLICACEPVLELMNTLPLLVYFRIYLVFDRVPTAQRFYYIECLLRRLRDGILDLAGVRHHLVEDGKRQGVELVFQRIDGLMGHYHLAIMSCTP
jgi:hypothetical protein